MPEKLRLRFEKTGRAIYISHLDLMRTMQRVFLRADCPLKYSEGFNPHALISILLPLSVGVGSVCELMDFQLREDVDLAALPERLTAVMPEGIRALEAYPAGRKVRELKWLRVTGRYEYDRADPAEMAQEPTLNPDHLIAALQQLAPDFAAFTRQEVYTEDMQIFR